MWLDDILAEHGDNLDGLSVRAIARQLGITHYRAHLVHQRIARRSAPAPRQLRRDYSSAGGGATLQQLADRYGLTRAELDEARRRHKWTHGMSPLDDDEIGDGDRDRLVDAFIAIKRRGVELRANDRIRDEDAKDAERWRQWRSASLDVVASALSGLPRSIAPLDIALPQPIESYAIAWFPTDHHYGGYSWAGYGGRPYCREQAATNLKLATAQMIARLPGSPARIIVPVGGDFFHVDTISGTTTKGTPQDLDGVPEQMVVEGMRLFLRMLGVLRSVAPLTIVLASGNHDKILSICLFELVRTYFLDDPGVLIVNGAGPYNLVKFGASIIGITHGDNRHKPSDLGSIMSTTWPQDWGLSDYRYWLVGHRHHVRSEEGGGVTVFQCPSLAGSDRYHTDGGYTQQRAAMQCHMFGSRSGYTGCIYAGL